MRYCQLGFLDRRQYYIPDSITTVYVDNPKYMVRYFSELTDHECVTISEGKTALSRSHASR